MNLELIRQLDSKVGSIACKYLYYYNRFRALFPPLRRLDQGIHRILIIKFWGIGNLVQASSTMRRIRTLFPHARIVFLTLEQNKGVYENSGLYDEAIYLRLTTLRDFNRELFRMFFLLRSYSFDIIFNMEPLVHFGELISFYVGVRTVGYSVPGRKSLFTMPVEFREDEHIARTFYRVLEPIGVTGEPTLDDLLAEPLPLTNDDREAAQELLRREGISPHDFVVGVNVNASEVAKQRRWPLENFATVVDQIIQNLEAKVVLFGAPDEVPYVQHAMAMMRENPINLAGRTTLHQAITTISQLDLFITNDSGPLHLAYALRVPTISFWGPESPRRYGPLGPQHYTIHKEMDCSPCIYFKNLKRINCKRQAFCLRQITVEEVYDRVLRSHVQWQAKQIARA
jgi:ADP-heptose:LPS heptosyltransferase